MKKIAECVEIVTFTPTTQQFVFSVSPPIDGFDRVYISARDFLDQEWSWMKPDSEDRFETYIFGQENDDWIGQELNGSKRGVFSCRKVLNDLGYEVLDMIDWQLP